MAAITGARVTTNILSDQLAIDMADRISLLEPDVQVLTVFSRAAGKRRTVATKFSWLEDGRKPRFDATEGTLDTTATSLGVDNPSYYAQWDLVVNTRTGEVFRVDSISGSNLNITRNIASSGVGTGTAMNDEDELYIIGTAQPENDTSKPARSDNPTKVTNYTQIFRTPFEQSGSLEASAFQVNPADWPHQSRKAGQEHAIDIELSLLFGKKSLTTPGSTEARTTGGALSFMTANQTDAGGELTEAEFNAAMLTAMRYGSSSKLAIASGTGVSALNKFPASKQQTRNDEKTYGMNVTHFTSPFGSLNLVYHRLLSGTKYGGYILIVDMEQVAWRPLGNDQVSRDTKILTHRQPNDQDGRKDEYLTEGGLEFGQTNTHALITGITS